MLSMPSVRALLSFFAGLLLLTANASATWSIVVVNLATGEVAVSTTQDTSKAIVSYFGKHQGEVGSIADDELAKAVAQKGILQRNRTRVQRVEWRWDAARSCSHRVLKKAFFFALLTDTKTRLPYY